MFRHWGVILMEPSRAKVYKPKNVNLDRQVSALGLFSFGVKNSLRLASWCRHMWEFGTAHVLCFVECIS
jgi:hypothetical protein